MAKNSVESWDPNPANNTDIAGINIAEGCPAAGINDAVRALMAQVAVWRAAATFSGNITLTGTTPQILFGAAGPRITSPGSNVLAFFNDGSTNERMSIRADGTISVYGPTNNSGPVPGSGTLRVAARNDGGEYYSITAFSFFDFKALQNVRQISGSNVQKGYIRTSDTSTTYNTDGV